MRTSIIKPGASHYLRRFAVFSVLTLIVFSLFGPNGYSRLTPQDRTPRGKEERQEVKTAKTEPRETKGAPYPPAKPSNRIPNEEMKDMPVPTGPKVGNMTPTNPPMEVKQITDRGGRSPGPTKKTAHAPEPGALSPPPPPLFFKQYRELTDEISSTSGCCPELSSSENGQTIMLTANTWMTLSKDGGASFLKINPSTIFPQNDGGFCCDQVVVYVPRIDMFVWLLQYWSGADGKNRIRLAAQNTPTVRSSNGTA